MNVIPAYAGISLKLGRDGGEGVPTFVGMTRENDCLRRKCSHPFALGPALRRGDAYLELFLIPEREFPFAGKGDFHYPLTTKKIRQLADFFILIHDELSLDGIRYVECVLCR